MSSSASSAEFRALVGRSLEVLRREHPVAYGRMCRALSGTAVTLRVDRESMTLSFAGEHSLGDESPAAVEFRSSRAALLAMLRGRVSLVDAILRGRADLRGPVEAIARFHDGLMLYLHGAVRAPSFPALVHELTKQAAPAGSASPQTGEPWRTP